MSESGDYDPGPWRGYNFNEAREKYDRYAGRSYSQAKEEGRSIDSLVPRNIKTDSESPLVIALDETASMGDWPSIIVSKLPYVELEGKSYLGPTMKISFCAIGDAFSDDYALQVRPFVSGRDLEKELHKLIIEKKGGPGKRESYDLPALYYARNVIMPNALKPVMIFIGDEAIYEHVDPGKAKNLARTTVEGNYSVKQVFDELKRKFSVYLIKKPYNLSYDALDNKAIHKQWADLIGDDKIATLNDPNRVVDVIFGLLAKETSKLDYFHQEISQRQRPEQVETVIKSLHAVHAREADKLEKSITKSRVGGKDIKSLL